MPDLGDSIGGIFGKVSNFADQLIGGGPSQGGGLLSPEQQRNVNRDAWMGMAAGLLKAAGPSPYKSSLTTLSGIGSGLESSLAARQASQKDAMTQSYIRTQAIDKVLPIIQALQPSMRAGEPMDPMLKRLLDESMRTIFGANPASPSLPGMSPPGMPGAGAPLAGGGQSYAPGPGPGNAPAPGPQTVMPRMGGGMMPMPQGMPMTTGAAAAAGAPIDPARPPSAHELLPNRIARENGMDPKELYMPGENATKAFVQTQMLALDPKVRAAKEHDEYQKLVRDASQKEYQALTGIGTTGYAIKDIVNLARAVISDPNFQSTAGLGADASTWWKQLLVKAGRDPNLAFTSELFPKVTAEAFEKQLEDQMASAQAGGGSGSKFYRAQIPIMMAAIPKANITVPATNVLLDQMDKYADRGIKIKNLVIDHYGKKETLGPEWDARLEKELPGMQVYPKGMTVEDLKRIANPGSPQGGAAVPPKGAAHRAVGPNGEVIYYDANGKRL